MDAQVGGSIGGETASSSFFLLLRRQSPPPFDARDWGSAVVELLLFGGETRAVSALAATGATK